MRLRQKCLKVYDAHLDRLISPEWDDGDTYSTLKESIMSLLPTTDARWDTVMQDHPSYLQQITDQITTALRTQCKRAGVPYDNNIKREQARVRADLLRPMDDLPMEPEADDRGRKVTCRFCYDRKT